ncbi:MAG TPA: hypothetical protein PK079_12000 [Leptospiraceae bacterium]|nr:hypothetical protein [Leptospiraceae bacterium]HMW07125.1 hypothetical protein [Leptospiraceae bacterium]HMX31799.1 hypothetical protein [Leptospiraceae bacterium]HMY32558.1 hypothetical protein [Leptospiraceae bacterium]HMZ63908.1 hypothetical protein [Leptospiraceae bacterium]
MAKLLDDLEGQIILNQSDENTVANALKMYLNFDRGSRYDKRILEETRKVFLDKLSNKSYFFAPPKQNKLKAIGYNQIIHILVKRLWDEEDFFKITRNPSQISFISTDTADIHTANIKITDVQKFIANQNIFPFISSGDISFFSKSGPDQVRKCLTWIKNGNNMPKFLDRIRLVGGYVQTVFFAAQNLLTVAAEYAANGSSESTESVVAEENSDMSDSDAKLVALTESQGPGAELLNTKLDYPYIVDILLFEIRSLFKNPTSNVNIQEAIKSITLRLKKDIPDVDEKHITLIYLIMKEVAKDPKKTLEDLAFFFQNLEEKLRIPLREIHTIYYLILSEHDNTLQEMPLSEFVDKCIAEDEKGILTETHIKILKSLFGTLPKEIKANTFYTVKEKIKARIEDMNKKKMVDTLSELIHLRVREFRGRFALNKLKSKSD